MFCVKVKTNCKTTGKTKINLTSYLFIHSMTLETSNINKIILNINCDIDKQRHTSNRSKANCQRNINKTKTAVLASLELDSLQRVILEGKVEGKRGRGRKRTSWTDNIKTHLGLPINTCAELALDRKKWRAMTPNLGSEKEPG